jgi:glyoxylase-like metal-dependent hydrolase (beta-lactamase superfamily II)
MRIGSIEITAVNDGDGKLPSSYLPKLDWERHKALLDAEGNFDISLGCFLIRTAGATILVDAGLGPVTFPPFRGGDLPGNLATAGVTPEDVDLVLVTHLHVDHIGWLAQDGKPYFGNATIRFGEKDLDQFMRGEEPDQFSAPIVRVLEEAGRIETVHGDTEAAPGVDMIDTPGHTLGHMAVVVSSAPIARSCSATRSRVPRSSRIPNGRRCRTSTRTWRCGRVKRSTASSKEANPSPSLLISRT